MKQKIIKTVALAFTLALIPAGTIQAMEQQQNNSQTSVSLIYYPSIISIGGAGHVKLEINGTAYNRTGFLPGPEQHDKLLNALITKANSGSKQFFRFVFDADETTVSRLLEYIQTKPAFYETCSSGAAHPLRKAGICSIPALLSITPLTMASYLTMSKQLGLDKITAIEYYGDPSLSKNLRIVPGVLVELICVSGITYHSYNAARLSYNITGNIADLATLSGKAYFFNRIIQEIRDPETLKRLLEILGTSSAGSNITEDQLISAINTLASERLSNLITFIPSAIVLGGVTLHTIQTLARAFKSKADQEQPQNLNPQSPVNSIQNPFNAFRKAAKTPLFKSILPTLY